MDTRKLSALAISDSGFVFDPGNGSTFNTNETGYFIINRLKAGDSVAAIADAMADQFDTRRDVGEQDIYQFIEMLRSYHLVV